MTHAAANDGFDALVIGAGVVGAAIAAALAARGLAVLVIERARQEGSGITSRNSGVIHSGLYYPPGSLKADTCLRGQALLYAWASARAVAHARIGKLVIARGPAELEALDALEANARASGVADLERLGPAAIARREPALPRAESALWCPNTGIVDPHGLTRSLRAAAEADGAIFAMGLEVTRLVADPRGGVTALSGDDELRAPIVVNAAGLDADRLAARVGVDRPIYPCRGDYFRLHGARGRYHHLIYPVRPRQSPGLGVHLTLELDGGVRLGPDAEYVDRRDDLSPPPASKLDRFHRAAEALLGPIPRDRLSPDGCGIRPKLRPPGASEERDFELVEAPAGCLHLLGIESPGLTAALALAERVAARVAAP